MLPRLLEKVQKRVVRYVFRRPFPIRGETPFISFTFDDFPRSALLTGGAILKHFGVTGTYYASFGLMGKNGPPGTMFSAEDARAVLDLGHELGSHTFDHYNAWETETHAFEGSIVRNRQALSRLVPGASFRTFSYPISEPRARTKRRIARHFVCSRGGGQTLNAGITDLNCLRAFFIEQGRHRPEQLKTLIDDNRRCRGWLILATHDVTQPPSPYGCDPDLFEDVVKWAVNSGARILPVIEALEALRRPEPQLDHLVSAGSPKETS